MLLEKDIGHLEYTNYKKQNKKHPVLKFPGNFDLFFFMLTFFTNKYFVIFSFCSFKSSNKFFSPVANPLTHTVYVKPRPPALCLWLGVSFSCCIAQVAFVVFYIAFSNDDPTKFNSISISITESNKQKSMKLIV